MSIPDPIDTKKHMRDMGHGYPEFDYVAAWHEARPLWDTLPANVRELFEYTRKAAAHLHQDVKLDLPWPHVELKYPVDTKAECLQDYWDSLQGGLRTRFSKVPKEELERAASVIHALGHWLPGSASAEDQKLFGGEPRDGTHWKFAMYADQSIRERENRPWRGREPRPPTELEVLCGKHGITADALRRTPTMAELMGHEWRQKAQAYMVTLTIRDSVPARTLTVSFWQGAAREKKPTAADVLARLVSDTVSYDNARSFEEWATDLGMDPDSRKAKRFYDEVAEQAKLVRMFLGDKLAELAKAEH